MSFETTANRALESLDKHRIGYYEAVDGMCNELEARISGFQEIIKVFKFLMPQKL